MNSRSRRESRSFRPTDERLESRLVMSGSSVPGEVRALLHSAGGLNPVRPNTPVLPFESPYATATFIDPSTNIINGKQIKVGQKDYIAPNVLLNAKKGVITIGSTSTIQNDAQLIANPNNQVGLTGIYVGDNVVIGDGAIIEGPAAVGSKGGAATSIGADALIDGAIIQPGAFVGALARVGPGVTVPTGYRVLPGANVINNAEASTPSLGFVAKVTSTDNSSANATKQIADSIALASGYSTLYQGNSATGGVASAGPVPAAVSASGSTIYFGALNSVLGVSSEPTSTKGVTFEPTTGTPVFLTSDGTLAAVALNRSYSYPARVIGNVSVTGQAAGQFASALGGVSKIGLDHGLTLTTNGDTIRADEGQPITIGSISSLGKNVSIYSPLGGIQGTTTTTVVTTTTNTVTGVTSTTSTTSTVITSSAPTATAGTTTATTTGVTANGQATTGTVTTTIATKTTNLGGVTIGRFFTVGPNAVILGSPTVSTSFGDSVTVGADAVVSGSTVGSGAVIGNKAYISGSTIPAGAVVPNGAIIINNKIVDVVQW